MSDVFISYARNDAARAELLKNKLLDLKLEVFFDVDGGIHAGDSFPERISQAVIESKVVLACWTPYALTRPWVRRECMMAREFGKLVPVALERLTARDLKEFIDASYEDLADYTGQETHFPWGQTLAAIARKLDAWVEEHPNSASSVSTLDLANALRKAAHEARRNSTQARTSREAGLTDVQKLWTQLSDATDPDKLVRFAESFPSTTEAFHARERAAQLRAEVAAALNLDKSSLQPVRAFIAAWPSHHQLAEIESLIPALEEQELADQKRAERQKAIEEKAAAVNAARLREAQELKRELAASQAREAEERSRRLEAEKRSAVKDREAESKHSTRLVVAGTSGSFLLMTAFLVLVWYMGSQAAS